MTITQVKNIPQILTVSDAVKPAELRANGDGIILVKTEFEGRPFAVVGFCNGSEVGYASIYMDTKSQYSSFGRLDLVAKCKEILLAQTLD